METIIAGIIAVLVPAAAAYLAVQLAKANTTVNGLPGIVKQLIAVAVAFGFAKLSVLLGVAFPADLGGFSDPTVVQGVLAGIASWLIHRIFGTPV